MRRIFVFLVFATVCVQLAKAQSLPENVFFEHLTLPGTIRSSQVADIIQDKYGMIWAADDGLFRYDGFRFTHYKQLTDSGSVGSKEINTLFYDSLRNRILIGTQTQGLLFYDYKTNALHRVHSKDRSPIISSIQQTREGVILVNSFSDGIHFVDGDTLRKFVVQNHEFINPTSFLAIGNKVWIDQLKMVYAVEGDRVTDSIYLEFPGVDLPSITRISTMMKDSKGNLWMGTERYGVFVYDTSARKFIKHLGPSRTPFFNRINKIFEDRNGLIWILAKSNGVAIYSRETDSLIHLRRDYLNESSLAGDNCTSILQDHTGTVWIGSIGGLNLYNPNKLQLEHIHYNLYSNISLADNMVRGLFEDRYNKIWIGTDGGVIHIYDRENATLERIPATLPDRDTHFVPVYFHDFDERTVLIGSSVGLLQFDRKTKRIDYFKPAIDTKNKMVRQIVRKDNVLFYFHSGTLFINNLETGTIESYRTFAEDNEDAVNVTALHMGSNNTLWLGVAGGVSQFDLTNKRFTYYPFEQSPVRPDGSYFMVLTIMEYQNKLWIGTFNSGIWIIDPNTGNQPAKNITSQNGLPNNTVYAIVPDDKENLWLATNSGIVKYTPQQNSFISFSTAEGMQQEEFNRLAYIKRKNGEIVLGGINGINIFHPDNMKIRDEVYVPRFFSLSVYNTKDQEDDFISLLNTSALTLSHDQNYLEVQYYIPNYNQPRRCHVLYKLENHDNTWTSPESNSIRYANLPPGDYTLRIKTISAAGREEISTLAITITPPFWQTWWFILIAVVVVSLFVYTILQSYSSKAKRDKERLENLLKERTREIIKSREELENLNQKKDLIFSILSHDLRSPLTTLKGFLTLLIQDAESISKDDLKRHATNIRNSVTSSLDLIDNTLFWSLSQTGNIAYTPTAFSVDDMLNKIKSLYQLTADKKRIPFSIHAPEHVMVYADENMMYVTLRNLVSNALKFTPEGKEVSITVSRNHQLAEVRIKDEGIGMDKSYIRKLITEENLQLKKGTSNEKGTGLGLVLCKKFIQLNNGYLEVISEEGKGTEFIVKLPLAKTPN